MPVLGEVLLAVSAWETLTEVYHGIEAWQDNHTRQACKHLLNVVTAVSVAGATTAAVAGVEALSARSSIMDNLLPAYLEDGSAKLWAADVKAFRSDVPPSGATSDTAGVFRLGSRPGSRWTDTTTACVSEPRTGNGNCCRRLGMGRC